MPYYDANAFANEFGSEAANMEYAILSSMLTGNGFSDSLDNYDHSQDDGLGGSAETNNMLMRSPLGESAKLSGLERTPRALASGMKDSGNNYGQASTSAAAYDAGPSGEEPHHTFTHLMADPSHLHKAPSPGLDLFGNLSNGTKDAPAPTLSASLFTNPSTRYTDDPNSLSPKRKLDYPGRTAQSTRTLTAEEAYRNVTKPYPYAQSYHYLVAHLKER